MNICQLSLTLCVLVCFISIQGKKIRDRFINVPPHQLTCGFQCLGGPKPEDLDMDGFGPTFIMSLMRGINLSVVCLKEPIGGLAFENGSFSGAMGEISRNEINTAYMVVPYTTPNDPGIFVLAPLPVFSPHIYSVPAPSKNTLENDVLELYTNFPIQTWYYFFISFCTCSILLLSVNYLYAKQGTNEKLGGKGASVTKEKSADRKRANQSLALKCIKAWGEIWYDYYLLSIDNSPITVSKVAPSIVLWTSIVLATYYGFHCVLMNTLSADLSVTVPGRWIDTFDELLNDHHFSNYTPTVIAMLNMLNVLSRSRNDTVERELYDRIMCNENESIIALQIDPSNLGDGIAQIMELLKSADHGTRAIIEDSSLFDPLQTQVICHAAPEFASRIKKSRDIIASAPQALLLSHSTHEQVVKLFAYRSKSGYELGLANGITRYMFRSPMRLMGYATNAKGYQCADNYEGKLLKVLHQDWEPMRMRFFQRLLRVCIFALYLRRLFLLLKYFLISL